MGGGAGSGAIDRTFDDVMWTHASAQRALDGVRERFREAVPQAGGMTQRTFEIAGGVVRLEAAGPELVRRFGRTFGHLETTRTVSPDLTVRLWDSVSSGTAPPSVPEVAGEQAPGAFFYFSDPPLRVGFQLGTSGDARVLKVYPHAPTPALSVLDAARGEAWYWVEDADRIPYWEEANPLRYLLDWWLRDRGLHLVHAASVGTAEGGVLLVGKSGSGKSTASLSVLNSKLGYAGDDYVAVELGRVPMIHSLYSAGKLMADHVARLPFLLPALDNDDKLGVEKAIVYVHEHWPRSMRTAYPLRAILVSRVTAGRSKARLVPASALTGLSAMAPSTVFQMHTRGQDSLGRMKVLAETVPTYVLEVGSDLDSISSEIAALLDRLDARDG